MIEKLYTPNWTDLDPKIRHHLREVFNVKKSGNTEIRDQVLISDGTTNEDLWNAFTIESMCKYIGSKETFARAWEITVSKAKYEINPPVDFPTIEEEPVKKIPKEEIKNAIKENIKD